MLCLSVVDAETQRDLIDRAQAGDARAFQALIQAELPRVRRFARAFCSRPDEADDLAQEALVKAFVAIRSYRKQARFSTWLYRIVRNCMVDQTRTAYQRRRTLHDPFVDDGTVTVSQDRPDGAAEQEQLRGHLWDALQQLSSEFRTAVVLFDVEGMSHEEIAEIEGVAAGTVKSRLSRGRRQLRAILVDKGVLPHADSAPARKDIRNEAVATIVSPERTKS